MSGQDTKMRREVAEIPQALERLLTEGGAAVRAAAREIVARDPAFFVTGGAWLPPTTPAPISNTPPSFWRGFPSRRVGPSVASIYKVKLKVARRGVPVGLAIGPKPRHRGPDRGRRANGRGAYTVAVTKNDAGVAACEGGRRPRRLDTTNRGEPARTQRRRRPRLS